MDGWLWLSVVLTALSVLASVTCFKDICNGDEFTASCGHDEVIVVDEAVYGRMEAGLCGVTTDGGHVGCTNDVMFLADSKCSGRRECKFIIGSHEFYEANTECNKEHLAYMRIGYSCVKVAYHPFAHCLSQTRVQVGSAEGFISSHVTDETGCGSSRTPWAIIAKPGQTIDLAVMDFGALARRGRSSRDPDCSEIYGYIIERSLKVNQTICAGTERRQSLYSSKTHQVEIIVRPETHRRDDSLFLIHYKVLGCSDLTPPSHAWYKRDGHTATIGCEGSGTTWQLTCRGNSWNGVVGNCSAKPLASADTDKNALIDLPLKTLLIVAAIAGATIVLAVLIIVAGVVCVKKYRHESESRANSLPGTLVYKPTYRTQPLPRGQYHAMTMSKPASGTLGSVHHTCTRIQSDRPYPSSTLPPGGRWTAKKGAPPPPTRPPAPLPNTTPGGAPQPEPSTSSGITRARAANHPLWKQPLPENPLTPEGVYQNPDDVIGTALRPSGSPGTVPVDPDDISSYYAPTTGHKYFILERQPLQNESQS